MKYQAVLLVAALCAAILLAGCTGTQPASQAQTGVPATTGKITVSGAFALYPLMVKWAEEYQKIHPGIKVEVSAGGAGKGMTDALSGLVDLGMVSREIYPQEVQKGAFGIPVAKDAVIGTINAKNPLLAEIQKKGIDQETLRGIFINESVKTWGAALDDPGNNDKIQVYTRSDAAGAPTVWAQYLGNYTQEDLKGVGVFGDPGLAEAVAKDTLGIGYNNIGFAYDATTGAPIAGLAIVPLDQNGDGVLDTNESVYTTRDEIVSAIDTGKYPSPPARELNLVTKEKFNGPVKDFMIWILTDGQQYAIPTGYIPLSPGRAAEQLAKVNA
jgi:phosphate transport system substrate-binding protein